MIDAVPYRDFHSAIGASVIDDQPLERVDSGKRTGEFAERDTERRFFIETRNLYDDFQSILTHTERSAQSSSDPDLMVTTPGSPSNELEV